MRACSQIPECSLSYTKIMQGECNGKEGKRSFTALDTAEPKLILSYTKIIIKWNIVKSLRNSFPFFQYIYPNYRCGISTWSYRGGSNMDKGFT